MQASRRGSLAAYPQDPEPRFPEGAGPLGTCFTASGQRPIGCRRCQPGRSLRPQPRSRLVHGQRPRRIRARGASGAPWTPRPSRKPQVGVPTQGICRQSPHMPHGNRSSLSAMPGIGGCGPPAPIDGVGATRTPVKTRCQRVCGPQAPKTGADRALRATGPLPVGLSSRAVGGPAAETGDGRVAKVRDVTHRPGRWRRATCRRDRGSGPGPGQHSQGLWARGAAADSTARRAALGWRPSCPQCQTLALSSNRHRRRLDIRTNLGSNRWTNAGRVR